LYSAAYGLVEVPEDFAFVWCICFKNSDNLLYSAAYGLVEVPEDFASYLLGIVLVNLLIYFFCYIIMKVLYMLQLPGLHLI